MVRVTRAGGRVVILESDFDGIIISSPDKAMTHQVIHAYTDRFPMGNVFATSIACTKRQDYRKYRYLPSPFSSPRWNWQSN